MRNLELEYDILLDYEYQIANRRWTNVYDFLADLGVELYPHFKVIQENRYLYPTLIIYIDQLNRWNEETYEDYMSYTCSIFHDFLLSLLREKLTPAFWTKFLKQFIVVDKIGKDGKIILNEEWCQIFSSPFGIPMVIKASDKNGEELVETPALTSQAYDERFHFTKKSHKLSVAKTAAEFRLEQFWNGLVADDFDICYVWKNKINTEDYNELVNRIRECVCNSAAKFSQRFACVLIVYMAEWYKREYNGNNKANPLKDLGIISSAAIIWKSAGLPDTLLYKMRNNLYQESIYTLGGLPIKYLVEKQFSKILKEISEIFQENNTGENVAQNLFLNNFALQESTRTQSGSFHQYIDSLINGILPIAETDCEQEPFRTFISNLQDWRQLRQKVDLEWLVEGNLTSPVIRRKIRLHFFPEANGGRHKSISYDRLARLGISSDARSFKLYLIYDGMSFEDIDEDDQHIDFYNTYDGYFVGKMKGNHFTFTDVPTVVIKNVHIGLLIDGYRRKIVKTFEVAPYLQLFETNQYSLLSSRKASKRSLVLLPYDVNVIQPEDINADKKYLTEGGLPYKLIEVVDAVSFTLENEESVTLYNHVIGMNYAVKKYFDRIKYLSNGCINHYYQDDDGFQQVEQIPILFSRLDIQIFKQDESTQLTELESSEYCIEFKQEDMQNYQVWVDKNQPKQGVVKLRISSLYGSKSFVAYFAPAGEEPFKRILSDRVIQVSKNVQIHSVPITLHASHDCRSDYNKYQDNLCSNDIQSDVIFLIGKDGDYVELPVYRPLWMRDVYKDGVLISRLFDKEIEKSCLAIPYLLKDHYSIRTIDQSGVHFLDLKEQKVSYLDFDFEDTPESIGNRVSRATPVGDISYYLCKKNVLKEKSIPVEKGHAAEYKFFYWSMKANEEPIPVETLVEGNKMHLSFAEIQMLEGGIVFQSLKDSVAPCQYYEPLYISKWPNTVDEVYAYKCFKIAAEYHLPYRIFEPIYLLFHQTDSMLIDLAVNFYLDNSDDDQFVFESLVRFSNEMYFTWPMLNILTWRQVVSRICIENRNLYSNDKEKDELKKTLKSFAVNLFLYVGKDFSIENKKSLEYFTSFYWGGHIGESLPFADCRWFGFNAKGRQLWKESTKDLAVLAVRFMRAYQKDCKIYFFDDVLEKYSKSHPEIIGFTKDEFKGRDAMESRDLTQIKLFLRLLENDSAAYVHIEQFIKQNLIKNN